MEFLTVEFPATPTFYALPKIDKNYFNPPGRPIVLGIDSYSSKVNTLISDYLYPHVVSLPLYLRDTVKLLQVLEYRKVSVDTELVSICD